MTTPWIIAFALLTLLTVALALLMVGLLRQVSPLLERSHAMLDLAVGYLKSTGLPSGAVVPPFSAVDPFVGELFTDIDLRAERSVVLFVSTTCAPCARLMEDLRMDAIPDIGARAVVVMDDTDEMECRPSAGARVLVQRNRAMSRVFASDHTPHAFVVDAGGVITISGMPTTWEEVRDLVAMALGRSTATEEGGARLTERPAAAPVPQ